MPLGCAQEGGDGGGGSDGKGAVGGAGDAVEQLVGIGSDDTLCVLSGFGNAVVLETWWL